MPNTIDETGNVYGRLTVLGRSPSVRNHSRWVCLCQCGRKTTANGVCLRKNTRSCGCLKRDNASRLSRTHGMSGKPEYVAWQHIKRRCYNPSEPGYMRYGGRGITVCNRWLASFDRFYADMGPKPSPLHSIERIDNNQGYTPENCKWATRKEQNNNQRRSRKLTYKGQVLTVSQWAEVLGISHTVLNNRLFRGWSDEKTLGTPLMSKKESAQAAARIGASVRWGRHRVKAALA